MRLRFLDFEADLDRRCLYRSGEETPLRPKAFQVLEMLLLNRERLVSREEIFASVWEGAAVTDDVLPGVIAELRKVLNDDPKSPTCIRTVPRQGYRFLAPVFDVAAAAPPSREVPVTTEPSAAGGWRNRRILVPVGLLILTGAVAFGVWRGGGVLPRGPVYLREVGWWKFDEESGSTVRDSSGQGNDGVLSGSAGRAAGQLGKALTLGSFRSGANGRDRTSALPVGDHARTVTAWFLARSAGGAMTTIFNYGPDDRMALRPDSSVNIQMRADGRLLVGLEVPNFGLDSRDRFDDGKWHQLAAVFRGPSSPGETHLYVDGHEQVSGRIAPRNTTGKLEWFIGASTAGETPFRGLIDDVRVFNGALNANTVTALYRCTLGASDVAIGGSSHYFLPIHGGVEIQPEVRAESASSIRNLGMDAGGIQFAHAENGCPIAYLEGTDVGQNLRMSAELLTPSDAEGRGTEAGTYFRSRVAAPGDGIFGGTSAGYAVFLHSFGMVSVRRLNPGAVVAFAKIPHYDPTSFHHLEVTANGDRLNVAVDSRPIEFDEGGHVTADVSIPSVWEGPPKRGDNQGAAGIVFFAENNRGRIGGQMARNVHVDRLGN